MAYRIPVQKLTLSAVLAATLSFTSKSEAKEQCQHFLMPAPAIFALNSPEIEGKFLVPGREAFESLQSLAGRSLLLSLGNGQTVRYEVEVNKQHIYEDVNYDTKSLTLFNKRGMLRERRRWDKRPGDKKYSFAKVVFQAKDAPLADTELNEAIFARNEIRGKEVKKIKKFKKKREEWLSEDSPDEAVQFARGFLGADKKMKPVLKITDYRYFLKLTPDSERAPWVYISLDDVTYRGLVGAKGTATRLELEAEIGDDLTQDSQAIAANKILVMDGFARYLMNRFGVTPSPESKYESGVRLTVLPK